MATEAEQVEAGRRVRLRRQIRGMLVQSGKRYPHIEEALRDMNENALLEFVRMLRDFEYRVTAAKKRPRRL